MTQSEKDRLQHGIASLSGAFRGAGEDRAAFVLSAHLFRIADYLEWYLEQDDEAAVFSPAFSPRFEEKQNELIRKIVTRS